MADQRARRRKPPEPMTTAEWATLAILAAAGIMLAAWIVQWAADAGARHAATERVSPPASLLDDDAA